MEIYSLCLRLVGIAITVGVGGARFAALAGGFGNAEALGRLGGGIAQFSFIEEKIVRAFNVEIFMVISIQNS